MGSGAYDASRPRVVLASRRDRCEKRHGRCPAGLVGAPHRVEGLTDEDGPTRGEAIEKTTVALDCKCFGGGPAARTRCDICRSRTRGRPLPARTPSGVPAGAVGGDGARHPGAVPAGRPACSVSARRTARAGRLQRLGYQHPRVRVVLPVRPVGGDARRRAVQFLHRLVSAGRRQRRHPDLQVGDVPHPGTACLAVDPQGCRPER